jgi:hypothetical protein
MEGIPQDDEIRRVSEVLERIAAGYAPDSEEAAALRDAVCALTAVAQQTRLRAAYDKLRRACEGAVAEPVQHDLRAHGISPEDFAD